MALWFPFGHKNTPLLAETELSHCSAAAVKFCTYCAHVTSGHVTQASCVDKSGGEKVRLGQTEKSDSRSFALTIKLNWSCEQKHQIQL